MSAERAWAYAMELRPQTNTEPRKHFSLLKKLRRAEEYAEQLEELCNACSQADPRTKLEANVRELSVHVIFLLLGLIVMLFTSRLNCTILLHSYTHIEG